MIDPLTIVLKGTLVLVVAIALAAALRRAPAGSRHLVWLATLATVVLFPLLAQWQPLRIEVLPPLAAPFASPVSDASRILEFPAAPVTESSDQTLDAASSPAFTPPASREDRREWRLPSLATLLLFIWLAGTVALLGWLGLGILSVRRIIRGGRDLTDEKWTTPLYEVADRMNLENVPRLIASDRVEMPFACGIVHPTIVFPATADAWSDERRRVVLFHELAHIQRRDLIGHALGRLACALYWFHPLVWTAARRLRAESERACDDLVLACGARASDYVAHLLDIVTGVRRSGAPVTALPMARRKEFEGRMLAILDPEIRRGTPGRMQSLAILVTVAAITLSVAAAAPASPVQHPEQAAALVDSIAPDPVHVPAATDTLPHSDIERARVASVKPVAEQSAAARPMAPVPASKPAAVAVMERAEEYDVEADDDDDRRVTRRPLAPAQTRLDGDRIEKLAKILTTDSDADVRISAAWALARVRDERATAALRDALRKDSDNEVREMAAWALVQSGTATPAVLIEALRQDQNEEVRETAAWGLGQMGAEEGTQALVAAIRDESAEVRQVAIWALGYMRSRGPATALADALSDASDEVRLQAAWALGQISDPSTAPALRAAFASEKDDEVRRAIFRALAMIGDQSDELINLAMQSPDPELRARAVRLLAGSGAGGWSWPWPWPRPRPSP